MISMGSGLAIYAHDHHVDNGIYYNCLYACYPLTKCNVILADFNLHFTFLLNYTHTRAKSCVVN